MIECIYADDPVETIAKARALADNIARILSYGGPTEADIGGAPVLDLYCPALCPSNRLIGVVGGHPLLRDRRAIMTSPWFLIDREGGWARTWLRFYALGRPADLTNERPQ